MNYEVKSKIKKEKKYVINLISNDHIVMVGLYGYV